MDPNKLSMKICKSSAGSTDTKESVSANKFYSKKEEHHQSYSSSNTSSIKRESHKESKPKKSEKSINKQLGNWQADVQSQLALPSDFTPELIAELAASGYDVVSGASRKSRQRQQSTLATSVAALQDSSDEEQTTGDGEYQGGSTSGAKSHRQANEERNRTNNRIIKTVVKYEGDDPNENPAFKRFNQILSKLILW